jgi:hypothetical protein
MSMMRMLNTSNKTLTAINPKTGKAMFEITVDIGGKRFCVLTMD